MPKHPTSSRKLMGLRRAVTNTEEGLKNTNNVNGSDSNTNTNKLTNYFLSSPNTEIDKRKKHRTNTKNITMCLIMF